MGRKRIRVTHITSMLESLVQFVKIAKQQNVSYSPFFSEQALESLQKSSTALKEMQEQLLKDCIADMQASNTLRKRSFLLTLNADGSLELTDVELLSPVMNLGTENICV